jgi:hypothetical protein
MAEKNETPNTSPLPEDVKPDVDGVFSVKTDTDNMTFYDAVKAMVDDNQKVTRVEWANTIEYGLLKDGILTLHKADGKYYSWIISDGDINADDWIIVA